MDKSIKQALINIVGVDNFTDKLIDLISYGSDASHVYHSPDCAVWGRNTAQVSALLKFANDRRIPVTARGAGTGLSGVAVPLKGGIVLDMGRMNKIVRISIEDRVAVVEPGVVYADLQAALAPTGFFYPPDPASGKVATLGGTVATNAGGIKGAKYGTTRDYVLGLEVVLADGSIMRTGSACLKCVSGYDLTRIFVGSEGTLGIVTEIILKINPMPKATATCSATFDDISDAGKVVNRIMRSGIIPSVMELMDEQCILALNEVTDLNLPEAAAMLLAETDGFTKEETEYQMAEVLAAFEACNAKTISRAPSAAEAEKLWSARKAIYGVVARKSYNTIVEDVTVPISKVTEMLVGIRTISQKYGVLIPVLGHIGDGNLHPYLIYDGRNPEEVHRIEHVEEDFYNLVVELGGTLTGEHGIGVSKAKFLPLEHDAVALRTMQNLKTMLDPNHILNPGKMGLEA